MRVYCHCPNGVYVEQVYILNGLEFDDSYCGLCSQRWKRAKVTHISSPFARPSDAKGTSTSPAEAPLRDIGRACFGITYPEDDRCPNDRRLPASIQATRGPLPLDAKAAD